MEVWILTEAGTNVPIGVYTSRERLIEMNPQFTDWTEHYAYTERSRRYGTYAAHIWAKEIDQ